jgi:precorrin-6Y C5,15-methyltransferase (decarboxylating)
VITVLGVAGGRVPPGSEAVLAGARVVAGGAAVLRALAPSTARQVVLGAGVDAALEELVGVDAVVLASGDPGFFGIVRALRRRVGPEELAVHPAPSSVAVAFARLGLPWDDALVVSAHARDPRPALATALRHPKVAILTDGDATPAWFAARLEGRRLAVCARLGLDGESIAEGTASELAGREWDQPNVLVSLGAPSEAAPVEGWALAEADFDHRAGMITKREVRAVALAALGPVTGRLIWDVGCGSGSVAVECARLGAAAFAVDHDADAIARTRENATRFGVPVGIIEGVAPMALAALPDPDAVFVGGGGDDVEAILEACAARATARTIVVTLALVERVGPVLERLEALGFAAEATLLQASRLAPLAGGHRLAATNPITIAVGRR